jgi:hypothetical protein
MMVLLSSTVNREGEMTEGLYALIGAALGVLGSLGTTYLNALLSKGKPDPVAAARKRLLLAMLADERFTWRKFQVLCHVIGADEATTKGLLLEIGARGSEDAQELWCLVTRHPLRGPISDDPPTCTIG